MQFTMRNWGTTMGPRTSTWGHGLCHSVRCRRPGAREFAALCRPHKPVQTVQIFQTLQTFQTLQPLQTLQTVPVSVPRVQFRAYSTEPELVPVAELNPSLRAKAEDLNEQLRRLEDKMSDGAQFNVEDSKQFSELSAFVGLYRKYEKTWQEYVELQELAASDDAILAAEAVAELHSVQPELEKLTSEVKTQLLPPHPFDAKACIIELRPGVGGDEAALFAKDLLDMYISFAVHKKWPHHLISVQEAERGIMSAALSIDELGSYKTMKFEKGVHRVQRIPDTESKGRVHTSTAAVLILPKMAEDTQENVADSREFKPDEIRIDVMRARGKGGQHVNTTDSAVRLTHYPSGIVISMQDERSQHKNKAKAFAILRAKLAEKAHNEKLEREQKMRKSQVTTTDRSDKIRTYNYTQNRITDHRYGNSLHDVPGCMNGTRLEELITSVEKAYNEERAKELLE